ncbi:MAG: hypothetical protein ACK5G0_03050 [Bacteroidota bacterium]|jgi:hypothetical protein
MSKLIHDWLVCGQSLPIEGVGLLQWERQGAESIKDRSTWSAPRWVLTFVEDAQIKIPTDFFNRLRNFSGQSAQPVEALYSQWIRSFKLDQPTVPLWALGAFERDQDKWKWNQSDALAAVSVQVSALPELRIRLNVQYDLAAKLLIVLSVFSIAWMIWQGASQGARAEESRSRVPATVLDSKSESLLYREVR